MMISNFLKTALRQMRKDKLSTFINTAGLAVSMASVMVISGFVWYELGHDGQFLESENIYRLTFDETIAREDGRHLATVSPPFAPELERRRLNDKPIEGEDFSSTFIQTGLD